MGHLGRTIILLGIITVILGFLIAGGKVGIDWLDRYLQKGLNFFRWIGHLPGDIVIHRPGFVLYLPITSSIIISIALTIVIWFLQKLF